ncbi:RNA polymerase sigma-70 factor [Sphingobacterium bambusae]|uniref:RNA polymerase sigma-70 factor n=1 Tax=Sphingobacterium bambusae TaxID=662858 RepID=A0ABW6BKD9_9SPHI|nr:RNA polymerase sigma-70 factor [Sphingobacterium bambusae]WPL49463.1 RNA polymerase sigma-70 factor [Sphingobacterium bambusae]
MYTGLNDMDLVALVQTDDYDAYTELYRRYAIPLLHHAFQKTKDREDAKDVVQEVFTMLWTKRRDLAINRNLSGFLYKSVLNITLNQLMHQEVKEKYMMSMELYASEQIPVADHLIREKQLTALIEHEVARLSPKMREVFELSRKEYLTHQEIAQRLGLSEQTVSKHITNALKILRKRLGIIVYLIMLFN